jgi:hypothetical protein
MEFFKLVLSVATATTAIVCDENDMPVEQGGGASGGQPGSNGGCIIV